MNRLSTLRSVRLFACFLLGLLCLAASRPAQAATVDNPKISVTYNVYNGGVYGMEFVDKVNYSFTAKWDGTQSNSIYCNYFITVVRDFYNASGVLLERVMNY